MEIEAREGVAGFEILVDDASVGWIKDEKVVRLIVAAPELYEVCVAVAGFHNGPLGDRARDAIRAAR